MLGGWYCRTLANEQNSGAAQPDEQKDNHHMDPNEEDSGSDESIDQEEAQDGAKNAIDYKTQYRYLKRKFKFLIYENEFFQDALRINQRRLLKVSRDRAFLLDRLLQYEKPENTSSESEDTESSEDEATKDLKRRKAESSATNNSGSNTGEPIKRGRKKRLPNATVPPNIENKQNPTQAPTEKQLTGILRIENEGGASAVVDGHMTAAEVERHLQSKRPALELMTERASATVPTEMFSNEPSLDSESNDHIIDGSSPSHVAAEECVPMEYTN